MRKLISKVCMILAIGFMTSCGNTIEKEYNQGINIIPVPLSLQQQQGKFVLNSNTTIQASTPEAQKIAALFANKLNTSTGFNIQVTEGNGNIILNIDPQQEMKAEGYKLNVTSSDATITAKTPAGAFYGMQTLLQLLPAEVESTEVVKDVEWAVPCVAIEDAPRMNYRGVLIDVCRHFYPTADIKKQIDVLAMFKINHLHLHLTEDQGWRLEIKKYPELTEKGSVRMEGEGKEYKGYYTQEEMKEIVAYAADRFITIVPELELPGHELAAISAYPHLSCTGEKVSPRVVWGVEELVMCPGKEDMFNFLEDVIAEMVTIFPGKYVHIGGDECPKHNWEKCPKCQARIRAEHLKADDKHTKEERLQSYVIRRIEKVFAKHGKKIIGWDEILEGGLSPDATVMSWRGEEGGIAAALQSHDVIMTPGSGGLYIDHYQGDYKIEPVAIGGYATLEKTYSYNPVPDTLVALKKDQHILGVQCNLWSEYLYDTDIMEYRLYPRSLALSEVAWSALDRKDFKDFARRVNNACVRLDAHKINYHIPQPEQPNGSCNFVAFTDTVTIPFKTTRPVNMVYTLDGSEPTPASTRYTEPLQFTESATLKIRSVLPSGVMSATRTITVEKQTLAPAKEVEKKKQGLQLKMAYGTYLNAAALAKATDWKETTVKSVKEICKQEPTWENMRGVKYYGAIANGYVNIEEDGVYYLSSNYDEVWIDGKLLINNAGEVKRFSRHDASVALAKGLHEIKVVFCSHIIGGWPSAWDGDAITIRKADQEKFTPIQDKNLFY